ncbi:MAG: HEAT repeat domain-containing protein [Deltaproteobacteria bacterium]|nr:HEAT repeat domain-containing protein [Deltaproteobacteria bacterium]
MPCFSALERTATLGLGARAQRADGALAFAEPGVEPNYGPSRAFDIEHIELHLDLEPEASAFSGEAQIALRPLPTWRGEVRLDLTGVTVDGVWDQEGNALAWRLADEALVIQGGASGLLIRWHGLNPERGLYFIAPDDRDPTRAYSAWTQCQDQDGHAVFPCLDHPSVKHPWTIELTGPAGHTLLSNGRQIAAEERDGRAWARFEQTEPMPAYLFSAVSAPLEVVEAADGPVPVRYLVPVGRGAEVGLPFGKTPLMIEAFARKTGTPYPWPRYDQVVVHDFIFGGMENIAVTTMTDVLLVDELGALEWDPDGLVSHELAHQWFGDLLTCQDWSQGWLNESWATFMETVWWEEDRAHEEVVWYRYNQARTYLAEAGSRYSRPIVSYAFREPIDVFDAHLYEKGAVILSSLRYLLGDDAFWAGTRLYLSRHAYGTVHTRHFQRAMEDATGQNLDRFFHQWIHSPGHPELKVALGREEGLVTVSVTQTQGGEGVPEAYHFPLRVEVEYADGRVLVRDLPVKERDRTWAIPTDGEVSAVRVDPDFRVLSTMKLAGEGPWLRAMLRGADPVMALRAGQALLAKGSAEAVGEVISAATDHPFWAVRAALLTEIGKLGGARARDALLDALSEEDDPRPRRAAAAALGDYRETVVADSLIEALEEEDVGSWQLYGALLLSLGKTRDPRAVSVIREHLEVDSWADTVRQHALRGLAATQDLTVLEDLLAWSQADQPERAQGAAATALGTLADRVEKGRTSAVERLVEMLDEPGFRPRYMAIAALATAGDPEALPALAKVHRSAVEGRLRRAAYEAMRAIRAGRTSEEGLAAVRKRMDDLSEESHKLRARLDRIENTQA